MSLTGTRSPDDRRRRRLATTGEGADAGDLDAGGVGILREKLGELPSASPWLPRQPWKRNSLLVLLWLGIALVATALLRPMPPHPQIAPAVEHLTQGTRPILGIYADIVLWTFAGQCAALVGWYRSHSQLDFQGRYRVWAWAAMVLTAWGFFAGTSLHTAIASVAAPQLRWPLWRAEVVVWLVPAVLAGLSVWWMADRDLQRHRLGVWLIRSAALVLMLAGLGELFTADFGKMTWFEPAVTLCRLIGSGLLATGLWCQAWYVAYVSADPPEPRESIDWRARVSSLLGWFGWLGWLGYLWPFRRRSSDEATKSKRRTSKKKDDEEDEDATPKRRRKPAARKRASKPRTRVKPEPEYEEQDEEAYEEEEAAEESWEETDDASNEAEDEWTNEYDEEPPARTPVRPNAPTPAAKVTAPMVSKPTPPAKPQPARDDEEDDEDDDGNNFRVDGGESGSDMFKGLSKRQRRELRKQMKDQQRQNRG